MPVVERFPLAACSFTTVTPDDLVPIDVIFPHYAEEAFEVRPSPSHRWYFRSKMTWRDIWLLKVYDNEMENNVAFSRFLDPVACHNTYKVFQAAPHGAFEDTRTDSKQMRSSVEVRCLVFG